MGLGIGRQVARGAGWMVLLRLSVRAIGLISTVILARLLLPEDFGLVALAMTVIVTLDTMSQFGFDLALIRNQNATRVHYDTAWTLSVIKGVVVALILVLVAEPAAAFFRDPRVAGIMYWLAWVPLIQGVQNIGVVDFRKNLEFHKEFNFLLINKIGGFVVTIPLAIMLGDYRALVAGILSGTIASTVASYVMHSYRPGLSVAAFWEMMHFSRWILFNSVLNVIYNRIDTLVIGRVSSAQALGLYTIAHEIASLPITEFVAPVGRALFPGYARIAEDKRRLARGFLDVMALTTLIGVPIAAGIGLTAPFIVHVFLGENWAGAIPLIQILAVFGIVRTFYGNAQATFMAIGRPQLTTITDATMLVVMVPGVLWATPLYGPAGAAWALVAATTAGFVLNLILVTRVLPVSASDLAEAVWRPGAAAAVMAVAVLALQNLWPLEDAFHMRVVQMLGTVGLGAACFIGVDLALWRLFRAGGGAEAYVLDAARSLVARWQPAR